MAEVFERRTRPSVDVLMEAFRTVIREEIREAIVTQANTISANDYEKIEIDLGIARTDEVIATNVHGFRVLRRTEGAVFDIKMIDATRSPLNQDDIPDGGGLTEFQPTNLLLTNPAQSGYSLTIVVFKRV